MKTKGELEQLAENIYREYPNNPLDFTNWHYNKDVNCHRKRKAFVKGYTQCLIDIRKDWQSYTISEKSDFIEFLNKQD